MSYQWVDRDRTFVSQRYDRMAKWIALLDCLLFVPPTLRRKAAQSLGLKRGDTVVELGCGTGLGLPYLRDAVGSEGTVYGVDISRGMLEKASALCVQRGWTNVKLIHSDAAEFVAPHPIDGVLFGLSYNTMPHHLAVLDHAWRQLKPAVASPLLMLRLRPVQAVICRCAWGFG